MADPEDPTRELFGTAFWNVVERPLLIAAHQNIGIGVNRIADQLKRIADAMTAEAAANIAFLKVQTEMTQLALELLKNQPTVPKGAPEEPETTAGGSVPGLVPLPPK